VIAFRWRNFRTRWKPRAIAQAGIGILMGAPNVGARRFAFRHIARSISPRRAAGICRPDYIHRAC